MDRLKQKLRRHSLHKTDDGEEQRSGRWSNQSNLSSHRLSTDAAPHPDNTPSNRHSRTASGQQRTGMTQYDAPASGSDQMHRRSEDVMSGARGRATSPRIDFDPVQPGLNMDMNRLSLGGDTRRSAEPIRNRYSEDVANRNAAVDSQVRHSDAQRTDPYPTQEQPHRKQATGPFSPGQSHVPSLSTGNGSPKESRRSSISRKPLPMAKNTEDRYSTSDRPRNRAGDLAPAQARALQDRNAPPSAPHAPPPAVPSTTGSAMNASPRARVSPEYTPLAQQRNGDEQRYVMKESTTPIAPGEVVDLRDTEDTTMHTRYAPAVTHETIVPEVHHIREQQITREIHNHDVFHRTLPIIDVQVLPAKHFVPRRTLSGREEFVEVPASSIPGRTGQNTNWVIAETVSKGKDHLQHITSRPQGFTAAALEDDPEPYITAEGFERTHTTWVHPPTEEHLGRLAGQTVPFHFGIPNPGFTPPDARDAGTLPESKQHSLLGPRPMPSHIPEKSQSGYDMPGGWSDGSAEDTPLSHGAPNTTVDDRTQRSRRY